MATVKNTFTVLDTPEKVWAALADFALWDRYLGIPDPQPKGWGSRFKLEGPPAAGARLQMLFGEKLMQEWKIDEFTPPSRLRLSSEVWHGSQPVRMDSYFDIEIVRVSGTECQVNATFDTFFSHPFLGPLMFIVPLKGDMNACLRKMERGVLEQLDGAR